MDDVIKIVLSIAIGILFLHYANRAVSSMSTFRSVFRSDVDTSREIVDGEPAAIEGPVTVEESAYASDRVVENTGPSVGFYLWRATFPSRNNVIDFENRTVREGRVTLQSGIESGTFGVRSNHGSIDIDSTWLLDTGNGIRLSELSVSGFHSHIKIAIPLWESSSLHLTTGKTSRTLDGISDLIDVRIPENKQSKLDKYYLEAKPIRDGSTIAVHGKIRLEQGKPVLYGTDAVPLVISDQGFDGLRRALRTRMAKSGGISVALLTSIAVIWIFF
ncbi:hypothetical protein HTG_04150 [Natrinema mahii]|nr:hypothetical protein HTG_04150 [Natrinema mahii]